jgi:phthiocerol/phenolphthiocerol synthesis type-I polyketide synthase E
MQGNSGLADHCNQRVPRACDQGQMSGTVIASSEANSKAEVREFYNQLNRRLEKSRVGHATRFLNYGYASVGGGDEAAFDQGRPALDPCSRRLIYELIGPTDLRGCSILDVGCGRGGMAALMADEFACDVTGVDFASDAIAFCRRVHRSKGLCFAVGDAERLPLADGQFDVVTNLESSHCYACLDAFFAEVKRVLRADGVFLYADLLPARRWSEVRTQLLGELRFQLRSDRCITANVVASLRAVSASRLRVFAGADARMKNVLAVPGSTVHERMVSGTLEYRILRVSRHVGD